MFSPKITWHIGTPFIVVIKTKRIFGMVKVIIGLRLYSLGIKILDKLLSLFKTNHGPLHTSTQIQF
jgi:hypothetical protein